MRSWGSALFQEELFFRTKILKMGGREKTKEKEG
jgi:hypothetical protein